jgi:hypothetical protein
MGKCTCCGWGVKMNDILLRDREEKLKAVREELVLEKAKVEKLAKRLKVHCICHRLMNEICDDCYILNELNKE